MVYKTRNEVTIVFHAMPKILFSLIFRMYAVFVKTALKTIGITTKYYKTFKIILYIFFSIDTPKLVVFIVFKHFTDGSKAKF